ncbi:hypothetical protein C7N43_27220 [Sphingobacteriales bacterium UPWRP_1]|nr:hypothetical protein C7N43_27220 [Sphingobacteriales bacterium UPWRP_1]
MYTSNFFIKLLLIGFLLLFVSTRSWSQGRPVFICEDPPEIQWVNKVGSAYSDVMTLQLAIQSCGGLQSEDVRIVDVALVPYESKEAGVFQKQRKEAEKEISLSDEEDNNDGNTTPPDTPDKQINRPGIDRGAHSQPDTPKPEQASDKSDKSKKPVYDIYKPVQLHEGINRITIEAKNNLDVTGTATLYVEYKNQVKGNLYMLSVGIKEFKNNDIPPLVTPMSDAYALANAFSSQSGKLFNKVDTTILMGVQATRSGILRALDDLRFEATQHDLVIIYLASHGVTERDRFYILPYEAEKDNNFATALRMDEIIEAINSMPCNVIVMVDACHSGAIKTGGRTTAVVRSAPKMEDINIALNIYRKNLPNDSKKIVMAAALENQTALEDPDLGHSVFAEALLEALGSIQVPEKYPTDLKADNGDNILHMNELDLYVSRRVKELRRQMHYGVQDPVTLGSDGLKEKLPVFILK